MAVGTLITPTPELDLHCPLPVVRGSCPVVFRRAARVRNTRWFFTRAPKVMQTARHAVTTSPATPAAKYSDCGTAVHRRDYAVNGKLAGGLCNYGSFRGSESELARLSPEVMPYFLKSFFRHARKLW